MSDAVLDITFAGPLVTVQDAGRGGFMRFGVPRSGPMDRLAYAAAQVALGNPPDAPAIEISLGGLILECRSGEVSFAITGGGFIVEHGENLRGSWMVATLRAGERLAIRPGFWGSWCYLAFAGRLQADYWLGSAATHSLSGFGGGRIKTGQSVTIAEAEVRPGREADFPCPVPARPRHEIRVTLGPQERFFHADQIAAFQGSRWTLTDAYDRMGVRLNGPNLAPRTALDIPSEPILRGSVQMAGDGVATVLLADHQTTGGYPKIATVLDIELDRFAQLRPRAGLGFTIVSPREAHDLARPHAMAAKRYLIALSRRFQC